VDSKKLIVHLFLLAVLSSGCSAGTEVEDTASPTLLINTPAPPATGTPIPTETPLPTSPLPTITPVEGTTSTQLNVRSQPSTAGEVLGIIPANTSVGIVGKDPAGNWWQILYEQGVDGKGWVTAQYVSAGDSSMVPVVGGEVSVPGGGNVAIVQQQINVRSGPGTGFNSLGTLNPQDVVILTGKDANSTWLQIAFEPGPDGKGWINAGFVQAQGVENLPIISEAGQVIGTGTPTEIPPTPSPTLLPAPVDNDSADNPIISVTFAPSGTRTLIYNGDVSAPAGDREDWIQFVPFSREVLLEVSCSGGDPEFELMQDTSTDIRCNGMQIVAVEPGTAAQIHIQAPDEGAQNYQSYTIKVESIP
jgi:uncharacterized protein YraI